MNIIIMFMVFFIIKMITINICNYYNYIDIVYCVCQWLILQLFPVQRGLCSTISRWGSGGQVRLSQGVPVTVTFDVMHLSVYQEICVNPSCRFSSDLMSPTGFLTAGMMSRPNARHTIIHRVVTRRDILTAQRQQRDHVTPRDHALMFSGSTLVAQEDCWGSQSMAPRHRPTTTLTVSSSKRNPQDEIAIVS